MGGELPRGRKRTVWRDRQQRHAAGTELGVGTKYGQVGRSCQAPRPRIVVPGRTWPLSKDPDVSPFVCYTTRWRPCHWPDSAPLFIRAIRAIRGQRRNRSCPGITWTSRWRQPENVVPTDYTDNTDGKKLGTRLRAVALSTIRLRLPEGLILSLSLDCSFLSPLTGQITRACLFANVSKVARGYV
jgi:hypothetical protein